MKVLMISGDARMFEAGTEAHERFLLQRSQVNELRAVVCSPQEPWGFILAPFLAFFNRYDVVTAQDPLWRGLAGLVAARISGAKLQLQLHGDLKALSPRKRALAGFLLRHADLCRAVSERIKTQAEALGARPFIDVLPVFVDLAAVRVAHPAELKREFPQFGKIILFAGRLEEEKNPEGALRAFATVAEAFPGAGLLILGDGSQRPSLEALARNLGLLGLVVFLGYRADARSMYKSADCMLVTSLHESFGAAIVEALAAGCPVVAPDVGVAREAGAFVVARDGLAQEVVRVLQSKARGALALPLLSHEEWARTWRQSLV